MVKINNMASFDTTLPAPLLYHSLKHHATVLQERITQWQNAGENGWLNCLAELKTIGHSQLDLYVGQLSAAAIGAEILQQLQALACQEVATYQNWLALQIGYQQLTISDGSTWTLRWGEIPHRFVHIHPSRHATHTQRIDAYTLQTVVATKVYQTVFEQQNVALLATVNTVRKNFLQLSPIQKLHEGQGIAKWLDFFRNS
jgi:hypothetical protein